MGRILSWLLRPRLLKALIFDVRLGWRLLREPRVPMLAKAVIPIAALYLRFARRSVARHPVPRRG